MAQQINIGVKADAGGAAKGVDGLDRAVDNLTDGLDAASRAADTVDKKLEKVARTAKKVADAASSIKTVQSILSKQLGTSISDDDAKIFADNFHKIRSGNGFGASRVRGFSNFQTWHQGHSQTFTSPQSATAHRNRIIASGLQGTSYAAANAPPPPPPPAPPAPPKPGRPPRPPAPSPLAGGIRRAGSSAWGIGAGVLGIAGIATGISGLIGMAGQGVQYATDEGTSLDTLKRRYGIGGISYAGIQQGTRGSGAGLGVSYVDSARLALQYSGASGRVDGDIGDHLRTAFGASRSLGVDPGEGTQFFGTMDKLGVAKDEAGQRRLAGLIADGIERGGFTAKADEVLHAVADYANTAFRATLSTPNVGAYLSGLTSLTNNAGLDPSSAAGIIGQANSAMMQGGAMGEASKNLSYAAIGKGYDPLVASEMWSGGLFATPDSIFGSDGARTMAGQYVDQSGLKTPTGGRMNLTAVMDMLKGQTGGRPGLLPMAVQSQFGLSTPQDALGLMWMNDHPTELGGSKSLLSAAGIDMSKMTNFSGISDIAKLAGAHSMGDIRSQYDDFTSRKDVTDAEKRRIEVIHDAGDVDGTKRELAKVLANLGQAGTAGSDMRSAMVDLKDVLTDVGSKLLDPLEKIKEAVVGIYSYIAPQDYKGKMQAEQDEKTDFSQQMLGSGAYGADRLKHVLGAADSEYDAAVKAAGGKPVDINALAPGPSLGDSADNYAAKSVRRQHLRARYNKDFGGALAGQAMDYYQGQGWPREASAGIVAGLDAESGFDLAAVGDGGSAIGIGQWHPDRAAAIEKHFGKSIRDMTFKEQLAAKAWELSPDGPEHAAGAAIRAAKSAREAGQLDSRLDARPGRTNEAKGYEASRRGDAAEMLFNGTPLPDNDPNGTRERAAANIRLHATADITVKDSSGRELGRAAPNLMQMPGAPVPAGNYFGAPL